MSTEKQKQAARENGAKSRGPVTPGGKRAASRNATTHGLLSKTVVLDGESHGRFSNLLAALLAEFPPRTTTEFALVESMAVCRWRQIRLWGMEKAGITHEIRKHAESLSASSGTDIFDPPTGTALAFAAMNEGRSLDLMSRYETRFDRQHSRALRTLMQLRAHRHDVAIDQLPPGLEEAGIDRK